MTIEPVLLSRILADAARRKLSGGSPAVLGRAVLVGYPPRDTNLAPNTRTFVELMLIPPAAQAAGLSMDMVCWPLLKRGIGGLLNGVIRVGRDRSSDVLLQDLRVSNHHATLQPDGDGFLVKDVGSANRTFINQRPLLANMPTAVRDGDQLSFGGVSLMFKHTAALMQLLLTRERV